MGRIHRYRTAWSRHHRSHGFGIHSPFAFRFVLDVLRERNPYYAYEEIDLLRKAVVNAVGRHLKHPRVISFKSAKMLFRLVNYFNPQAILQVGTSYGVSAACMLAVNSRSRLWLYEPHLDRDPVTGRVLAPLAHRIDFLDHLVEATTLYRDKLADSQPPFVLINDLPGENSDYEAALAMAQWAVDKSGVVVLRNISRKNIMKKLWLDVKGYATYGQTFTNDKLAILVANPKLQREDFLLWF